MSRYDIVVGWYLYCVLNHAGMGDWRYERLSRIMRYFHPGAAFSERRELATNYAAREVYNAACDKHGGTHVV